MIFKKNFRKSAALFVTASAVFTLTSAFTLPKMFSSKIALGAEATICDCALLGGNNNCAANNYGASCAGVVLYCSDYNSNCEG
ncbi:hypothetical protein [Mucilaginibacter aquaedulcis]|uniref:hypothetical protein n=1 Tax=Mucilaginibacter aquaedulcis TaxID=1187081 RepID=UPI0025B30A52|nr:hypothetical protein [Mucilaginibacter aquaedulcis]MDN3548808.1 hypothetical protein [Mucilaginibacter aquaedulcis]